jgi:hypothetical protein
MPEEVRRGLVGIMTVNAVAIAFCEYFIVNDLRHRYAAKRRAKMQTMPHDV